MTMKVDVNVTGSALVYFKHKFWNIVFITDNCHLAKFRNPNNGNQVQELATPDDFRVIEFSAADPADADGFKNGEDKKFLNLYDPKMHGDPNGARRDLIVRPQIAADHSYVHLKIPYGTIKQTGDLSNQIYYSLDTGAADIPFRKGLAKQFSICFDIEDPKGLTMSFQDTSGEPPLNFENNGGTLNLVFDNYCDTQDGVNDFLHYYEWVHDTVSPSGGRPLRFITMERPHSRVYPMFASDQDKERIDSSIKMKIFGRDGDCDPVIIEPPPGD